jgi:hypothetical protein
MTYTKNIGFQEMVEFSQDATPAHQQEMESNLTQDEMKTSLKGMSFGIDQSLPENEWFVNMDPTRVLYF